MRLIVFRELNGGQAGPKQELLRYAVGAAPLNRLVFDGLRRQWRLSDAGTGLALGADSAGPADVVWALPRHWQMRPPDNVGRFVSYADTVDVDTKIREAFHQHPWLVICNGRFATRLNGRLLTSVLDGSAADVVAVTVAPRLAAYRERVRLTPAGRLVGYRRQYEDSAEPIPFPADWPHHLFVRVEAVGALFANGLPRDFRAVTERCRSQGLAVNSISLAGLAFDLNSGDGLLSFCRAALDSFSQSGGETDAVKQRAGLSSDEADGISSRSRLIGPVLLGRGARVEPEAVVIGPSIICDGGTVRTGGVVDSSIVGSGTEVKRDQIVKHAILVKDKVFASSRSVLNAACRSSGGTDLSESGSVFRNWPVFSYARFGKRVADVLAAVGVLVLFAPIIPFIALAVKINSPGPVFFKDKRQGLHGRLFDCIKFRTMKAGADKMQDKLRFVSEVDGPQFKMADDPRITAVGHFLRETYLDEIPQFFNVLMGDMSVVGPRPSPESENTLCAWWRDARLSIRPGITGMWQVCRTREPMKDFQEWIHYDTQYVRELSLRMDLWICWRTFTRMVYNFVRQF